MICFLLNDGTTFAEVLYFLASMARRVQPLVSFVLPVFNENAGIEAFHKLLIEVAKKATKNSYEIIYCDDGSTDKTVETLRKTAAKNPRVRVLKLSRHFGKEIATTAGIQTATGKAVITLDADGQHPVKLIPRFIEKWQDGHQVVIGLRLSNQREGFVKRFGSKLFYKLINKLARTKLVPGSTDYRLIDSSVQQEFNKMTEHNRITRGLVDWLGYDRAYVRFHAAARTSGQAGYSFKKLFKLSVDSVISLSLSPLYLVAYIGAIVLPLSTLVGITMLINFIAGDPLGFHAKGTAYISVLTLFLIGVLMVSQGIIGLYLSHIHTETQNRPLYIIDRDGSVNLNEN